MIRTSAINLVLKVGLAVTSIAFAIASFWKASEIVVFYPNFVIAIFGEMFTLALGAAAALVMGIWLLSRKHKFAAAFTYTILILLAILFNLDSIRFLSTGWPLLCMALALSIRYYPRIRVIVSHKFGNKIIERMKIMPAFPEDDVEGTGNAEDAVSHGVGVGRQEAEAPTIHDSIETQPLYGKEEPFEENKAGNDVAHKYSTIDTVEHTLIPADIMPPEQEIHLPIQTQIEPEPEVPAPFLKKPARIKVTKKNHRK